MHARFLSVILLFAALACDSPSSTSSPDVATSPSDGTQREGDPEFRSVTGPLDWCDVYTCQRCPSTGCPPGGHQVTYCCPLSGSCGARHEVPAGSLCPEGKQLVICNWGQTNTDGSFTCFDT